MASKEIVKQAVDPFADDVQMERELCEAIRDAILDHRLRGDPIAVAENGRVIWIPAEQIPSEG